MGSDDGGDEVQADQLAGAGQPPVRIRRRNLPVGHQLRRPFPRHNTRRQELSPTPRRRRPPRRCQKGPKT